MARLCLFLTLLFITNNCFAQSDTEFWFAAPAITKGHENTPIVFRLTTYSKPAIITISQPANPLFNPIIISLGSYQTLSKDVTALLNQIESTPSGTVLSTGIKISATANISAYYEVGRQFNPEIFPLKGKSGKGLAFLIPSQMKFNNHEGDTPPAHNGFVIVASENNTKVNITLTNPDNKGHSANQTFQVVLQKGETYAVEGQSPNALLHLGGSMVNADKPISVTIFDDSVLVGGWDLVGDQIVPISNTGTEFILVRGALSTTTNFSTDIYYIWATEDDTEIFIDGAIVPLKKINKGKYHEGYLSSTSTYITTSKPVYVLQFTGMGTEATQTSVPSIKCTGSSEVSFVRSTSEEFYLNIICKSTDVDFFSVNGNGSIITSNLFNDVTGAPGWKVARITRNNLPNIDALFTTGVATSVINSAGLFHLGFLNGGSATGARLGYFSNYSRVTLAPNITSSSCLGGDIQLAATILSNVNYTWTGPNGFTSNISNPIIPKATIIDSGYYYVEANLTGCGTSIDSVRITINPLPTFQLSKTMDTVCLGNSKSIQFALTGKMPWELVYSDGIKSDTLKNINSTLFSFQVSPLTKTIYSFISVSDSNACLANAAAIEVKDTIVVNKLPIADFNYSAIHCEKSATIFTDISAADLDTIKEWYWDMGNGTIKTVQTNTPFNENYSSWGNYKIKLSVKSLLGCISDTISKTITILAAPNVGFKTPSVCLDGGFAVFKDTSSSRDIPTGFTYLWNFNAGLTPLLPAPTYTADQLNKAAPSVLYNKEGTYLVSLKVTTSEGCIDSVSKPFIINGSNPVAVFKVFKADSLCSNEEITISDSSWVYPGTIGKLNIDWGDGVSSIIDDPALNKQYKHLYTNAANNNLFIYAIKVQAYSGGTCMDDSLSSIGLVVPPTNFNIEPPTTPYLCINDTLQLIPAVICGTPPFTYDWATSNANASFSDNIIKGLLQGAVNVNVTITDSKQCRYEYLNKLALNLPLLPIAAIFATDTVICNGDSITLKGTGGGLYKWYNNTNLTKTDISDSLRIGISGNYSLVVNDGQCNSLPSISIPIIDFAIPIVNISYNPLTCLNGLLAINTDAADKYKIHYAWDFGDNTYSLLSNPLSHSYIKTGPYVINLKVTNDYCPRYDTLIVGDTVQVVEPLKPSVFTLFLLAEMDTMLNPLRVDTGYTQYQWAPASYLSNPFIASPIFNGPGSRGSTNDYILTRTNPITSCTVADVYKLDISSDVVVSIPKAFTPNGDNLNDVLKLELGAGLTSLVRFTIFNRWGKIVFSTQSVNEGWDGKTNGINQEMDGYTYFVEYINYKNERFKKTGSVALLR